jgi:hypothetical protein
MWGVPAAHAPAAKAGSPAKSSVDTCMPRSASVSVHQPHRHTALPPPTITSPILPQPLPLTATLPVDPAAAHHLQTKDTGWEGGKGDHGL